MEKAIYNILSNDGPVSAITTQISPSSIPQDATYPAITFQRISNDPSDTKDGVSTLDVIMLDIDIWNDVYATGKDLADKVRTALDRTSGTYAGRVIQSIRFETDRELFDDNLEIYHFNQEYSVRYKR